MVFLTCQSYSRFWQTENPPKIWQLHINILFELASKISFSDQTISLQGLHNISLAEASCTERVSEVLLMMMMMMMMIVMMT